MILFDNKQNEPFYYVIETHTEKNKQNHNAAPTIGINQNRHS